MSTAPVVQTRFRGSDPRRVLVERAAVLFGRVRRSLGRGWAQWRKQAGPRLAAAIGGGLGAMMGRALTAKGTRSRMLAVEERLTLGPKQHLYVIRCGEQRLLVASAGEAALQWMALPEESGPEPAEACGNTLSAQGKTKNGARGRASASPAGERRARRRTARATGAEGAR